MEPGTEVVTLNPAALVEVWPEQGTTVVLRNIPNRYTAEESTFCFHLRLS